ncbi:MAG: hypothetical protein DBX40_04595 [Clostridiales bacterium]|nr:MAG: hypothetical protein DBX40_04595 [Clostridiales bacterium]
MDRIIMFDKNQANIGLSTRSTTPGTEYEMVSQFIEYYCDRFLRYNKSKNLAVFVEPRIVSGFPDIVFASFSPSITDNWTNERNQLDTQDLKVLSHMLYSHTCSGSEIIGALRLQEKQVLISLEKLLDANLIIRRNKTWQPVAQSKIFSIQKLLSVEAKIGNIKRVSEQSLINTWFASQSYALTNSTTPTPSTIESFQKYGIGLYCKEKGFKKIIEARQLPLPSSYLSLQFNEWIGKALQLA